MEKRIILANVDLEKLKVVYAQEQGVPLDEFDEWQAIMSESGWMRDSGIDAYSVLDYHHYQVLTQPIPYEDLVPRADKDGYLSAYISVDLSDVIACDLEQFLDLISIKAVNSELFSDISYEVVQNLSGGDVVLKVTGCIEHIIEDWDKTQDRIED